MPNMSYCRFENTFRDLKDCKSAFEDEVKLSKSELDYALKLIETCRGIAEFWESWSDDQIRKELAAQD